MSEKVLVINLGSTSTKIAVYKDVKEIYKENIHHSSEELKNFISVWDQKNFRKVRIEEVLINNGFNMYEIDAVASRGGNIRPVNAGIYEITEKMLEDMHEGIYGVHPTNVGNQIAYEMGREYGIPVITADVPVSDELIELARYSGMKDNPRISSYHALNQKRSARVIAKQLDRRYEDLRLIVVHMGGGISVGSHEYGRVIDVNNALDGEGPFSPERAGTIPVGELIKLCFSGRYTLYEMMKKIKGQGGLMSYLGTNSGLEVEERIQKGDKKAEEVFEAMSYQISKEIGASAAVLKGRVDGIILTGSLAYNERLLGWIKDRISFIAPVFIIPGENEMLALAEAAHRYLNGIEKPLQY